MITTIRPQQPSPSDAKSDAKSLLNEHVLLRGITWETFQSLMIELESQPSKRLTYDNGLLEIWMPLAVHERYKKLLTRLVEVVTLESEIEMCSLGSCTWSRKDLLKGVEADECYYIQHEAMIRGKMAIDLTIDPPPDLAIEVDVTSLSLPRLPIYGALGVPEVWRVYEGTVQILVLQNGNMREPIDRFLCH
jgi:Uma2 family endonuclease